MSNFYYNKFHKKCEIEHDYNHNEFLIITNFSLQN